MSNNKPDNIMTNEEFKGSVEKLNKGNYSFANDTLYFICQKHPDILGADQAILAGKIEMIGRIYAASPERRSYTLKDSEKEIKSSEILGDYGDGQGGFFPALVKNLPSNTDFQDSYQECKKGSFRFDLSESDRELLYHSIRMVLRFNQMIKSATIEADQAAEKVKEEDLVVKNQISFCSKFLHFHFPHHVFIVDTYSSAGSSHLFPSKDYGYLLAGATKNINGWDLLKTAFNYTPQKIENPTSILECIQQEKVSARINSIQELLLNQYTDLKANGTENIGMGKNQDVTENAYIQHAIRAYLACCLLKKTDVTPTDQIKQFKCCASPISSYPRWADCVLMNIKLAPKQNTTQQNAPQQAD